MASNNFDDFPNPFSWTPTAPLPQIPSTDYQSKRFPQHYETAINPQHLSPYRAFPAYDSSATAQPVIPESSLHNPSPISETQISIGTPVTSVGSSGKRKGPPEVQWDASKDRKYARLYSLSDADIDDLPIIMRDDKLKFEKRIAQEKSAENLGPRPNELRPNPKDPKQMHDRIKQSYVSKRYLEEHSHWNRGPQPNFSYPIDETTQANLDVLERQLEEELSGHALSSSGRLSHQFFEALENFAQNLDDGSGQRSIKSAVGHGIRSSYESLLSLRRRLNERKAKSGQQMREYSDEELGKYIFVKRLSVGSLPSSRSTTSSLLSKRTSNASELSASTRHSSSTLRPLREDQNLESAVLPSASGGLDDSSGSQRSSVDKVQPAKPLRHLFEARRPKLAPLKSTISEPAIQFTTNTAFSPSLEFNYRQPREEHNIRPPEVALLFRVEGFPHVGPRSPTPTIRPPDIPSQAEPVNFLRPASFIPSPRAEPVPALPTQQYRLPQYRPLCCINRCRGDPRVDKCPYCELDVPPAHKFVRWLIDQRLGVMAARTSRPAGVDFGQVDDFGDTLLHLASSLGGGSAILSWLISMGVDVHAKNVVGQTFMHVFNPVAFADCDNLKFRHAGKENISVLLNTLEGMKFDFNARDDFGQTPMHVLTQYWLHAYTMQLACKAGMAASVASSISRDFRGRSVRSQIKAQAFCDHENKHDEERGVQISVLLKRMKPSATGPNEPKEDFLKRLQYCDEDEAMSHPHAMLRKTILIAFSGFPETKNKGRNGLHCLAESCISLRLEPQDQNTLKRKRQAETILRHEYIVNTIKKLLEVGVDPNDYDKQGNTPMMAFIRNDLSLKPERKITAEVLQSLINAGASVHRRNRRGETALHIAMRLGRPSAVEVLLNNYANVHSRARDGEGVLAVAGKASLRAKQDGALYHRVITCMAIAGKYGAILGPSTKDEWDRQRRCVNKEGPVMIELPRDGNDGMENVQ